MDIISRLKEIISYSGLSVRGFAIKCGIPQKTLDNQIKGLRSLSLDTTMSVLYTFPEISAEWLIRGTGEMIKPNLNEDASVALATTEEVEKIIKNKDDVIDLLLSKIRELENRLNEK